MFSPRGASFSRREALARLGALAATAARPRVAAAFADRDPLEGAIADYAAGLRSGRWSAADVTTRALERCRADGMAWRAIDALSATAVADAKAADARRRGRKTRGPLDGVPVFAKAIDHMNGLGSCAGRSARRRRDRRAVRSLGHADRLPSRSHRRRARGRCPRQFAIAGGSRSEPLGRASTSTVRTDARRHSRRERAFAGVSRSGSWAFRFTAADLPPVKPTLQ